jgi:hypothetical protein
LLRRPVFETTLKEAGSAIQRKARQEEIMKPTILFSIAGLSLLTVVATPAQLNEQGVSTPENN